MEPLSVEARTDAAARSAPLWLTGPSRTSCAPRISRPRPHTRYTSVSSTCCSSPPSFCVWAAASPSGWYTNPPPHTHTHACQYESLTGAHTPIRLQRKVEILSARSSKIRRCLTGAYRTAPTPSAALPVTHHALGATTCPRGPCERPAPGLRSNKCRETDRSLHHRQHCDGANTARPASVAVTVGGEALLGVPSHSLHPHWFPVPASALARSRPERALAGGLASSRARWSCKTKRRIPCTRRSSFWPTGANVFPP